MSCLSAWLSSGSSSKGFVFSVIHFVHIFIFVSQCSTANRQVTSQPSSSSSSSLCLQHKLHLFYLSTPNAAENPAAKWTTSPNPNWHWPSSSPACPTMSTPCVGCILGGVQQLRPDDHHTYSHTVHLAGSSSPDLTDRGPTCSPSVSRVSTSHVASEVSAQYCSRMTRRTY